jgi:mono/diheme cytochrome c family protein
MAHETTRLHLALFVLLGLLVARAGAEPVRPDGAAVFKERCAKCHGESGRSDTADARALKVRPLIDDSQIAAMAPDDIVRMIKADSRHRGLDTTAGLDDAQLRAAAVFVKGLAKKR